MTSGEFYDWQTEGGGGDLRRLSHAWSQSGISWCVIGGLAVNHWAKEPLVTKDADIVVAFSDLTLALESARNAGFDIKPFRFSANLTGKGNIAIQVTTDPRYSGMAERAQVAELFGMTLPVASLEDTFQGKLWAWSDPERRPLKRRKDELDLLRLVEAWPALVEKLPEPLRSQADMM
ncbi:MAG: nucleotidyl transferase AbiEii/AbiGii toxin family protein [Roseimicrobium sp.]